MTTSTEGAPVLIRFVGGPSDGRELAVPAASLRDNRILAGFEVDDAGATVTKLYLYRAPLSLFEYADVALAERNLTEPVRFQYAAWQLVPKDRAPEATDAWVLVDEVPIPAGQAGPLDTCPRCGQRLDDGTEYETIIIPGGAYPMLHTRCMTPDDRVAY